MDIYFPTVNSMWDKKVALLYKRGLSTRQVAKRLGISSTYVGAIVKRLGISRSKHEAAKPGVWHKPNSKHWRTMRARARKLWELENGPIPKGYHIHHIDGDCTNNALGNLALLPGGEHNSKHSRGPEYSTPRHKRIKRKEYMEQYLYYYGRGAWEELEAFKKQWRRQHGFSR